MKIKHNEKAFRKMLQTALQNDNWYDHDKPLDLEYLLCKVQLGGNALRVLANLHGALRESDNITKEFLMKLEQEHIHPVLLKMDGILTKMDTDED
jgi:hypothetical protein